MSQENMYDLVIIGGGPAGSAAAVYAARKKIKSAILTPEFGGQSVVSDDIQNWIGTPHISGFDLGKSLEKHVKEYQGDILNVVKGYVSSVEQNEDKTFSIKTNKDLVMNAKAVLVTTGSVRRKLDAINADKFEHKGVTYCASCDGPVFANKDVVVIGGGNAAFESALQLAAYCKSVKILNRTDKYRADEITVDKVSKNEKIEIINNAVVNEVHGDQFVNGLTYNDTIKLDVEGIFVEIGQMPNTDYIGFVDKNPSGNIIVDPRTQKASVEGVWAAGDCTDGLYHQNNIAVGDAVKALESLYIWLQG
ncbi:FAD-dependent oxidoreductase [Candidatus Parcubacteria bacterium]|nr:FAD-dependent oxidoreductase [Candidatus Parcubacteria bacterium]